MASTRARRDMRRSPSPFSTPSDNALRTSAFLLILAAVAASACDGSLYSPTHGPRLSAVRFLAFGDSVTEGADPETPCTGAPAPRALRELMLTLPALVPANQNYPSVLQQLLRGEFTTQQPTVAN